MFWFSRKFCHGVTFFKRQYTTIKVYEDFTKTHQETFYEDIIFKIVECTKYPVENYHHKPPLKPPTLLP